MARDPSKRKVKPTPTADLLPFALESESEDSDFKIEDDESDGSSDSDSISDSERTSDEDEDEDDEEAETPKVKELATVANVNGSAPTLTEGLLCTEQTRDIGVFLIWFHLLCRFNESERCPTN